MKQTFAMLTARLVPDLNEMIIENFITDYPTFRRFLITVGDSKYAAQYIRKYLKKFIADKYVESHNPEYIPKYETVDYRIDTTKTFFGVMVNDLRLHSDSVEVPFVDFVNHITLPYAAKSLENLRAYSGIESIEVRENIQVSPEEFLRTFPKLRKMKCSDVRFIDDVLAISTTIKEVDYRAYHGLDGKLPMKYPGVKFTSSYDGVSFFENSGIPFGPVIENLSCTLNDSAYSICNFDPMNANVESLRMVVSSSSQKKIVIPSHFTKLRFLTIIFYYSDCPNVDIEIDGFPVLEFVEIFSNCEKKATCRIANVPYIFCLKTSSSFNLDIDYETVSILEYRN